MPSNSSKSLRIVVLPVNGQGHLNACHGLCEELRDRGHQIIFLLDPDFSGRLKRYGFEEVLLPAIEKPTAGDGKTFWQSFVEHNAGLFAQTALSQMTNLLPLVFRAVFEAQLACEAAVQAAIDQLQPDLIILDSYVSTPPVVNSSRDIPWVWMFSASPQAMFLDPKLPPFYTGLPLGDTSQWREHEQATTKALGPLRTLISEHSVRSGGQPMPAGRLFHEYSPFLNLYMSPLELQYSRELLSSSVPSNVIGVDCFLRTTPNERFSLPAQLADRPGKLVFFSMGSFGCSSLPLMTRLVAILAKSPHRFIVSKGPLKYELPGENLWGEEYLPQTAILPLVDLVITHGGNNSVSSASLATV